MMTSLRIRLLAVFMALAILPLVVGGGLLAWLSYRLQLAEVYERQHDLAARMTVELDSFFDGIEGRLASLDLVREFTALDAESQRRRLAVVLAERHDFRELALLDEQGRERAKVSAGEPIAAADLGSRADREEFRWPMAHGRSYSGPIRFDRETGEPLMTLAVPFIDGRDGPVKAVLVAELRVRRIWNVMQERHLAPGQEVAVLDADARVIAHRNPSVVLRETRLPAMPKEGRGYGVDGTPAYLVTSSFKVAQQPFVLVAEYAVAQAMAPLQHAGAVIGGVMLLAILTVLALAWFSVRRIVLPIEAVSAAAMAVRRGKLEQRVEVVGNDEIAELARSFNAMTRELQAALDSQRHAVEEVGQLNQQLERRVAERTAALEASNKELEAFAYSVSHDLRAPLRAIDGFSHIVLDEYGDRLDAEGRKLLASVRSGAERMGQLIDDILALSRMARQEMALVPIELGTLARQVFAELAATAPRRRLHLELAPLPPASGDPVLLRQVLENLIANAIKFTAPRDEAIIEIGGRAGAMENEYFVRDNGVGFDMNYAGKLFGVFQRLHPVRDFEGTGIGLAIVKRIIARHGGRVWAEGKVDAGATVHFTLPGSGG
ncbi:MAG TPA: ATP-binding protein [Rhodocyclaceae bacterium]